MKKIFVLMAFMILAGCETTEPMYANSSEGAVGMPPAAFSHFTDIPVPDQAAMNLDRTVIMGAGEDWTGKLAFVSPHSPNNLFDFYMEEMPKFGWKEVSVVRAQTSFMTYSRQGREMIIQIYGDRTKSNVDMMVSPQRTAKKK